MKKKFISIVSIVLVIVFAFAACGGATTNNNDTNTDAVKLSTSFATGGTSGTYYPYGGAISQVVASVYPDIKLNVEATGASKANIRLVADGDCGIAIVQNDVMDYAYNGTELFEGEKVTGFSTLATVYSEVCQIVVDPASGINSIADLKGKKVSVGDAGSGVEANAKQILAAYGITFDDIVKNNLSFADSSSAMKDKQLDAFFVTAGAPTTAVVELAVTNSIKILSIDDDKLDSLKSEYGFYTEYTIPAGTYTGVDYDVKTLAVKATLIVNNDLSEDVVYAITKAIFENADAITKAHEKGKELVVADAVNGVSVPFHAGAEKYFKEVGAID